MRCAHVPDRFDLGYPEIYGGFAQIVDITNAGRPLAWREAGRTSGLICERYEIETDLLARGQPRMSVKPGRTLSAQGNGLERSDKGLFQLIIHPAKHLVSFLSRHSLPVGSMLDQCCENV